jgi:hypothetical protein
MLWGLGISRKKAVGGESRSVFDSGFNTTLRRKAVFRGIGILPMTSSLHGQDARATSSQAVRRRTLKDWPKTP